MRSKFGIIFAVLIIAAIVVGFYLLKHHQNTLALIKPPAKATVVAFAKAKQVPWPVMVGSVGTISSKVGVTLRAQVTGRVVKILVPAGLYVKKGTVLYVIYPDVLEAELNEAKSRIEISTFMYTRMKQLYAEKAVSEERYIQAQSNLVLAKSRVKAIEARLTLTNIYAPFDGVIGLNKINVNDYVLMGDSLATFQASDHLRVDFAIPQKYFKRIKINTPVLIKTGENGDHIYYGNVYAINPLINHKTRMLDVRASIESKELLPGMFADVMVLLDTRRTAIVVPQTAVVQSLHGAYVYRIENQYAKKVFVKLGNQRKDQVAIIEGLKVGDVVVSAGQLKIQKNVKVTDKGALTVKLKEHNYDGA